MALHFRADDPSASAISMAYVTHPPANCRRWVRVNHQSLDSPLVILADQALEIIAAGKSLHIARALRSAEYIDVEPSGLADAGCGPETK